MEAGRIFGSAQISTAALNRSLSDLRDYRWMLHGGTSFNAVSAAAERGNSADASTATSVIAVNIAAPYPAGSLFGATPAVRAGSDPVPVVALIGLYMSFPGVAPNGRARMVRIIRWKPL